MRVRLTRRPGQWGTHSLVSKYGDRLVCVRYRYDAKARKRYKTVELIVDEQEWEPAETVDKEVGEVVEEPDRKPAEAVEELVALRVGVHETVVQKQLRAAGARWLRARRVWVLPASQALALGLGDRIVAPLADLEP
jgi:replicative superfamily II helicase